MQSSKKIKKRQVEDFMSTTTQNYVNAKITQNIVDGDTTHSPSSNIIFEQLSDKLNISAYNDRFKGKYSTLSALQLAHTTSNDGDYAIVDAGLGIDALEYIWDTNEGWVKGNSTGATTTDVLSEGSISLYFTTARVLATLLTGISFVTGGEIVSTDSILIAFGKIQKQLSDLVTIYQTILVSGTSIKTINGSSVLGGGNLTISSGVTLTSKIITSANLTTQDLAGFLIYVNDVTSFTITLNEIVKYQVTDTGQIFEIKVNNRIVGSGQTALTSSDVTETRETFLTDFGKFSFDCFILANGNLGYISQQSAISSTTGTINYPSFGGSNWIGKRRLANSYYSAATIGSFSQVLSAAPAMAIGNANTIAEFFCASEHTTAVNTVRSFSGMKATTSSIGNVDPSTLTQIIGIGNDSGDTNMQIMHNDTAGTATKLDLGSSFPAKYNINTNAYRAEFHNFFGTVNWLVKVENLVTGAKTSRYISTDVAGINTQLYPFVYMGNGLTASEVRMLMFSWIFKNY